MRRFFQTPSLTSARIRAAYTIAMAADAVQAAMMVIFPPGMIVGLHNLVDIVAMFLLTRILGFHILLLPTFLLETMPGNFLPTWTACTIAVVQLRKKEQNYIGDEPPAPPDILNNNKNKSQSR